MKRHAIYITIFFSLWSAIAYSNINTDPPPKKMVLVIDPGHGGHDKGCTGENAIEKELVLEISLQLAKKIENELAGVKVILTRSRDVFVPLVMRTDVANKKSADLFISIHCNAINHPKVRGTETFVMGLHRSEENLDVAKRENKSILLEKNFMSTYQGYDPESPAGHILMSLYQNAYLEESLKFAELVESAFHSNSKIKSRGVKQAGFVVLRTAAMPSVLIETGFLTNESDEQLLQSKMGQKNIVDCIFKSVQSFNQDWLIKQHSMQDLKSNLTVEIPDRVIEIAGQGNSGLNEERSKKTKIKNQNNISKASSNTKTLAPHKTINFKVQVAASSKAINLDHLQWKPIADELKIVQEDALFKCYYGAFDSYKIAKLMQAELREKGFGGAFVVAFEKGAKIPVQEAIMKTEQIQ